MAAGGAGAAHVPVVGGQHAPLAQIVRRTDLEPSLEPQEQSEAWRMLNYGRVRHSEQVSLTSFHMNRWLKRHGKTVKPELKDGQLRKLIKECFDTMDSNQLGFIDEDELELAMHALGMPVSRQTVHLRMSQAHVQSRGKLTFDDFVNVILHELADRGESAAAKAGKKKGPSQGFGTAVPHSRRVRNGHDASAARAQSSDDGTIPFTLIAAYRRKKMLDNIMKVEEQTAGKRRRALKKGGGGGGGGGGGSLPPIGRG